MSLTGRYTVRFNEDWEEAVGIARDLIEVA
jgi:hypothetical protein